MLKKTLALFFMLMLLTPLAVWLLHATSPDRPQAIAPVDFPSPYGGALLKADYYRALNRYINEQFVFRERLQRMKNWVDYKVFRRTDRSDIHVGRQGWLYRRVDVENHVQGRCGAAGSVDRLLLDLHAIEKLVTASGRRFIFLVVPSKASVYPEYIGWVPLPAGGRCSAYDLLREAHHDHPLESWVPLESAILANKFGSRLLYDAIGSYWNGRGAAVAAEALHHSLFKTSTLAPVLGASDHRDNLERQLLGRAVPVPRDAVRHLAGQKTEGLGHGLVYGDAGIESLLPHLARMARRLEIISAETVPSRQIAEDWRSFDSILIQTTESGIQDVHIDLDRVYDQLYPETERVTRTPVDLQAIRSIARTALNTVDGGLAVKSVGARSTFALNDLPGSYQRCFRVLRLNLSALQPDVMTVEYRTHPPIRVAKSLHPERFNLYLPLPVKSRVALRFQPGGQAGLLVLHEAEIIGFPEGTADACGRPPRVDQPMIAAGGPAATIDSVETTVEDPPADTGPAPAANNPPSAKQTVTHRATVSGLPSGIMDSAKADGPKTATATPGTGDADNALRGEGIQTGAAPRDGIRRSTERSSPQRASLESDRVLPPTTAIVPAVAGKRAAVNAPSAPAAATIALNDFADGRIFQRQGHRADIIVSGVYTGAVSGIEARVVRHDRSGQVVPWTTIDAAPRNGIFLGLLPGVPEGGWYVLEVRTIGAIRVTSQGRNRWGVGILIACIGQSNMKEWFNAGDDLEAHSLLRMYAGEGWQELGRRGNGAIACGNRIIARTGVPVGLLEYAVNGSGLHRKANWGTGYWEDIRSGSIYQRFVSDVGVTGGRLEYVLWIQGEADAARGRVTGEEYQTALTRFINRQVRLDISNGSTRPQLPFLVVSMVKRPGGRNEPHQAVREAQLAVTDQVAECYLAATTLDLRNMGKQHLAPEAYTTMGRRVAQTILYTLGLEDFYRGPRVMTIRPEGERMLNVTVQHRGGDDLTPSFGITGWEVVDHQGVAPIQKVLRHDSRTIRILLDRPLQGPAEVRYLYGAWPDARRPLMDNASPRLPLEAFRGDLDLPAVERGNKPADGIRE